MRSAYKLLNAATEMSAGPRSGSFIFHRRSGCSSRGFFSLQNNNYIFRCHGTAPTCKSWREFLYHCHGLQAFWKGKLAQQLMQPCSLLLFGPYIWIGMGTMPWSMGENHGALIALQSMSLTWLSICPYSWTFNQAPYQSEILKLDVVARSKFKSLFAFLANFQLPCFAVMGTEQWVGCILLARVHRGASPTSGSPSTWTGRPPWRSFPRTGGPAGELDAHLTSSSSKSAENNSITEQRSVAVIPTQFIVHVL